MELSSKTKGIVAIQEFLGKGNLTQEFQGHRLLEGQKFELVGELTLLTLQIIKFKESGGCNSYHKYVQKDISFFLSDIIYSDLPKKL